MHAILLIPQSSADIAIEGHINPVWIHMKVCQATWPQSPNADGSEKAANHVRNQILQAARLQICVNLVYANGPCGCKWCVGASACPVQVQTLLLSGRRSQLIIHSRGHAPAPARSFKLEQTMLMCKGVSFLSIICLRINQSCLRTLRTDGCQTDM